MSSVIKNIYLIEENKLMQETLAETVAAAGFSLICGKIEDLEMLPVKPQMILFDIDQQNEKPIESLRKIIDIIPGAYIIATSRWMDDTLEKQMQRLGFAAGLIKPFEKNVLLKAVNALEQEKSKMRRDHKSIAFFSPKGKSGKTTLIVNLALALAERTGKTVGILDADLMFADVSVFVNIEPKSTLAEVVRDLNFLTPALLDNYFEEVTPQVKVLCGIRRPEQATVVSAADITKIINMAKESFDYLLIDTQSGFNPISIAAAEAADSTYIMAMNNSAFVTEDLKRTLDIFTSLDDWQERVRVLITRINNINMQVQQEFERAVGYKVFLIPNEYILVSEAANKGRMAKDVSRESALSKSINQLAAEICQNK